MELELEEKNVPSTCANPVAYKQSSFKVPSHARHASCLGLVHISHRNITITQQMNLLWDFNAHSSVHKHMTAKVTTDSVWRFTEIEPRVPVRAERSSSKHTNTRLFCLSAAAGGGRRPSLCVPVSTTDPTRSLIPIICWDEIDNNLLKPTYYFSTPFRQLNPLQI